MDDDDLRQQTMFGPEFDCPVARDGDPESSHEAAALVTATGARGRHCRTLLALLKRHPGHTSCELWAYAQPEERRDLPDVHELRRRLSDLRNAGRAVQGPARACRVRGTRQCTWWAR